MLATLKATHYGVKLLLQPDLWVTGDFVLPTWTDMYHLPFFNMNVINVNLQSNDHLLQSLRPCIFSS